MKEIVVGIQKALDDNVLVFHLKEETKKHLDLGKALYKIKGIVTEGEKFPLGMKYKGNYEFLLEKAELFDWKIELLPEIKKVIQKYFKEYNYTVEFVEVKAMEDTSSDI